MALRRALSLRSLRYQPSYCVCSSLTRHGNDHEEKPNYPTFLRQRSFSSSILSQHPRSSSHLSLSSPFGASSIFRSISTSGADESGNLNGVAATPVDSVFENVLCHVPSDWSFHYDWFQRLIETVHSFTGLDSCASIVLATLLIRGVTIPLMIYHEREWSRTMVIFTHANAVKEIGDRAAIARHKIEFKKMVKENLGVFSVSVLLPCIHVPALMCMGTTVHHMMTGGGLLWSLDLSTINISLLTGCIFWITVEYNAIVGFEGVKIAHRNLSRKMVFPVVLAGLFLSKEVHCYLISCMLFSIAFMYAIGRPGVMTLLRIPEASKFTLSFSFFLILCGNVTMIYVRLLKKIFQK